MPNLSIDAINQVLQKIQAPGGSGEAMKQFLPGMEQSVRGEVQGQDTVVPQMKEKYLAQLAQIAAMDQKLAGVYGDPNSKLYIERASTRENLKSKALNTGYKETSRIAKGIQTQRANLEKDVSEIIATYKQLTAIQEREEKKSDKQSKVNVKAVTTKKKELAKDMGMTIAELDQVSDAGIYEHEAINEFLQAPAAFRKLWVRNMLQQGAVPEGGFSAEDIRKNLEEYNLSRKTTKADTKTTKAEELKKALGIK